MKIKENKIVTVEPTHELLVMVEPSNEVHILLLTNFTYKNSNIID